MKKPFDLTVYAWRAGVNYRQNPELYQVGKGEQGVLICEPYKGEILPFWKFKTPEDATVSSQKIFAMFKDYLDQNDFIGADMARKFIQMGFTRARRYANYKGGRKYDKVTEELLTKGTGDAQKIISAQIFYDVWQEAEQNIIYKDQKKQWKQKYG